MQWNPKLFSGLKKIKIAFGNNFLKGVDILYEEHVKMYFGVAYPWVCGMLSVQNESAWSRVYICISLVRAPVFNLLLLDLKGSGFQINFSCFLLQSQKKKSVSRDDRNNK